MGICTSVARICNDEHLGVGEPLVEEQEIANNIQILLLGTADSGKNTIMTQIKLLHADGYSLEEKIVIRKDIYFNIIDSMQKILNGIELRSDSLNPDSKYIETILNLKEINNLEYLSPEIICALKALWDNSIIKKIFAAFKNDSYIGVPSIYFFENLQRICDSAYIPTDKDILRVRHSGGRRDETFFKIRNNNYVLNAAGSRSSERGHGLFRYKNVKALIFTVSLNDYEYMSSEHGDMNRIEESLHFFEFVSGGPWFEKTPIFLIFTKSDLFAECVSQVPIQGSFPDYKDGPNAEKGKKFFKNLFENSVIRQNSKSKRHLHIRFICATDPGQVEDVMNSVHVECLKEIQKLKITHFK